MDYEQILSLSADLLNYAEIEGSELGYYWRMLSQLHSCTIYMSDDFRVSYEKELQDTVSYIRENFRIEYEDVTFTRHMPRLVDVSE